MQNISVGRYPVPSTEERAELSKDHPGCQWPSDQWQGWIVPEDNIGWRAFIGLDGVPIVFLD
jgi:hypothetical protein